MRLMQKLKNRYLKTKGILTGELVPFRYLSMTDEERRQERINTVIKSVLYTGASAIVAASFLGAIYLKRAEDLNKVFSYNVPVAQSMQNTLQTSPAMQAYIDSSATLPTITFASAHVESPRSTTTKSDTTPKKKAHAFTSQRLSDEGVLKLGSKMHSIQYHKDLGGIIVPNDEDYFVLSSGHTYHGESFLENGVEKKLIRFPATNDGYKIRFGISNQSLLVKLEIEDSPNQILPNTANNPMIALQATSIKNTQQNLEHYLNRDSASINNNSQSHKTTNSSLEHILTSDKEIDAVRLLMQEKHSAYEIGKKLKISTTNANHLMSYAIKTGTLYDGKRNKSGYRASNIVDTLAFGDDHSLSFKDSVAELTQKGLTQKEIRDTLMEQTKQYTVSGEAINITLNKIEKVQTASALSRIDDTTYYAKDTLIHIHGDDSTVTIPLDAQGRGTISYTMKRKKLPKLTPSYQAALIKSEE